MGLLKHSTSGFADAWPQANPHLDAVLRQEDGAVDRVEVLQEQRSRLLRDAVLAINAAVADAHKPPDADGTQRDSGVNGFHLHLSVCVSGGSSRCRPPAACWEWHTTKAASAGTA
jgi:hypothetical protein